MEFVVVRPVEGDAVLVKPAGTAGEHVMRVARRGPADEAWEGAAHLRLIAELDRTTGAQPGMIGVPDPRLAAQRADATKSAAALHPYTAFRTMASRVSRSHPTGSPSASVISIQAAWRSSSTHPTTQ